MFYSLKCLGQRQKRDVSVIESSCHLPTCPSHAVEALHCLFGIADRQAGKLSVPIFGIFGFDPTGNQTRVYRFSSRRSIYSTTDRVIELHKFSKEHRTTFSTQIFSRTCGICNVKNRTLALTNLSPILYRCVISQCNITAIFLFPFSVQRNLIIVSIAE